MSSIHDLYEALLSQLVAGSYEAEAALIGMGICPRCIEIVDPGCWRLSTIRGGAKVCQQCREEERLTVPPVWGGQPGEIATRPGRALWP